MRFKAAAVQASPVFLEKDATIEKACLLIEEASSNGAELIVFPESFIPGHPLWFKFMSMEEGMRRFYKTLFTNSVAIPSRDTDRLCEAAKKSGCIVVMGLTEKGSRFGTLYNSQLFIGDDGRILGIHRKIMPTSYERLVHGQGDGSTLGVFETRVGRIGGLICGEHSNMLACFALLAMGEEVHAASWPAFGTKEDEKFKAGIDIRIRYYAYAGKVYVVSSCGVYDDMMINVLCDGDSERLSSFGGGSGIVGPDGQYVAGPVFNDETIIYGYIDLERIIDERAHQDITGHYNRFDIFKLIVNAKPHRPIEFER